MSSKASLKWLLPRRTNSTTMCSRPSLLFAVNTALTMTDRCVADGHQPLPLDDHQQAEDLRQLLPPVSRRGFMKLTGAAAVFGLAGCWVEQPDTLVGYYQQPEGTTLGKPVFYSSLVRTDGVPQPVMVKTYDGRPIKLEGNPDAPFGGSLGLRAQAAILDLYDPDRLQSGPQARRVARGSQVAYDDLADGFAPTSWADLDAAVGAAMSAGGKVALLTGPIDGPANEALLQKVAEYLGDAFQHVVYHPHAPDAMRAVRKSLIGSDAAPVYHYDKAELLVTFGSDPVADEGLKAQRDIAQLRKLGEAGAKADLGQILSFESLMSQTGSIADMRFRCREEALAAIAWNVAGRIADELGKSEFVPAAARIALPEGALNAHPVFANAKDKRSTK